MNLFKKQDGFTLIEIILSALILMVFIFAFMTLSTSSITGIFGAGHKSSALFEAQEDIDNAINEGLSGDEPETHEINLEGLEIKDSEGVKVDYIEVEGEVKEIPYSYEDYSGTLYYFYPTGN